MDDDSTPPSELALGTEPEKVARHAPKFLIEVEFLDLGPPPKAKGAEDDDEEDEDEQPSLKKKKKKKMKVGEAFAFRGFGGEVVPLVEPQGGEVAPKRLLLEGQVDEYLRALLEAMEQTLRARLDASVARFPTTSKLEWLMAKQPYLRAPGEEEAKPGAKDPKPLEPVSIPVDPDAVSIYVATLYNTRGLTDAMAAFETGTSGAFKTLADAHGFDVSELCTLVRANLSPLDRVRVGNELVLDTYHRDACVALVQRSQVCGHVKPRRPDPHSCHAAVAQNKRFARPLLKEASRSSV